MPSCMLGSISFRILWPFRPVFSPCLHEIVVVLVVFHLARAGSKQSVEEDVVNAMRRKAKGPLSDPLRIFFRHERLMHDVDHEVEVDPPTALPQNDNLNV